MADVRQLVFIVVFANVPRVLLTRPQGVWWSQTIRLDYVDRSTSEWDCAQWLKWPCLCRSTCKANHGSRWRTIRLAVCTALSVSPFALGRNWVDVVLVIQVFSTSDQNSDDTNISDRCRTRFRMESRNGRRRPSSWPRTLLLWYSLRATLRSTGSSSLLWNDNSDLRRDMSIHSLSQGREGRGVVNNGFFCWLDVHAWQCSHAATMRLTFLYRATKPKFWFARGTSIVMPWRPCWIRSNISDLNEVGTTILSAYTSKPSLTSHLGQFLHIV